MANFVFEMYGFDKNTNHYERKIGKIQTKSHKSARLKESKIVEEFKKTHNKVSSTGVVEILDENFFNAIT